MSTQNKTDQDICTVDCERNSDDSYIEKCVTKEHTSLFPGIINCQKSIVGSGIWVLPYTIACFGIIPSGLMLITVCIISGISFYMLCECGFHIPNDSFRSLTKASFGRCEFLVDLIIVAKCMGVVSAYMVLSHNLMLDLLTVGERIEFLAFFKAKSWILFLIFEIIFIPFSFLKSFEALKYTSFAGMIGIFWMIFVVGREFVVQPGENKESILSRKVDWFKHINFENLSFISIFIFSFMCHQNAFMVKALIKPQKRSLIQLVISISFVASLIIYLLFGYLAYFRFGDALLNNECNGLFTILPKNIYSIIGLSYVTLLTTFSIPLQVHTGRIPLMNILNENIGFKKTSTLFIISTCLMLLPGIIIGAFKLKLTLVMEIIGSTTSTLLSIIFPSLFYLLLETERPKKKILIFFFLVFFNTWYSCTSISTDYNHI